ncbi:hypothetical protein NM208_g17062 [Fusarium decemcellulare]|uniref:Uncharacterized protein n=1 Tax=Fusarium decemcellulare TaxID=57161 RepID=A0ACC1RCJ4_9HYPO|nr:hypothetical protein NM208_g17062 [Fusarium decemcellulare]
MAPTRIILDTDLSMGAGADVDDGFALALAHADPDIQLDLVTTVNGNTDLESATILTGVLLVLRITRDGDADRHEAPACLGMAAMKRAGSSRFEARHWNEDKLIWSMRWSGGRD